MIFWGTVIYNKCRVLGESTRERKRVRQFAQACPTLPDWTWTSLQDEGGCRGSFGGLGWGWPTTTFATVHAPRDVAAFALSFAFALPLDFGNSMSLKEPPVGFWLAWVPTLAVLEPARVVVFANLVREPSTDLPLLLLLGLLRCRPWCTPTTTYATHVPDSNRPNPRPRPRVLPLCTPSPWFFSGLALRPLVWFGVGLHDGGCSLWWPWRRVGWDVRVSRHW